MLPALNGANGNRVNDQPRFGARLDYEKAANLAEHLHH